MFAYLVHPDINPEIIHFFGPIGIRWYSLMYIIGFLFVYYFIRFLIKKQYIKITELMLSDVLFYAFLGVIIGGRLGYVLFYNLPYYLSNPLKIFAVWEGGMAFHGGFLGVVIAEIIYCVQKKINFFDLMDLFAIPVPVALGFGRWGNFVNQELWGRPTTLPWGMIFPKMPQENYFHLSEPWVKEFVNKIGLEVLPGQKLVNLPRHPSQLYEMLLEGFLLFAVMLIFMKIGRKERGFYSAIFLIGYGLSRLIVEFFREPDKQLGYLYGGWLTMGMLLSLPMIIAGIILVSYSLVRKEKNLLWAK
ncbi:MAG: prolipoprotein diacylglyceryl transferase [Brevinematia bacterium]